MKTSPNQEPTRPLRSDFTQTTMRHARLAKKRHARKQTYASVISHKREGFSHMKPLQKFAVGFALFALVAGIGGTTYAMTNGGWSSIKALFGGKQKIAHARIVAVNVEHCDSVTAFNITKNRTGNETRYFKIADNSTITNDDVIAMVKADCYASYDADLNTPITNQINNLPVNKDKLVGGYLDNEITAIGENSITVKLQANEAFGKNVHQTFTDIDLASLTVIAHGKTMPFSELKVGDHVAVSYRASADLRAHSETTAPEDIDASQQQLAILTVLPYTHAFFDYQKNYGKTFEQVAPCNKTAIGYCTLDQYQAK